MIILLIYQQQKYVIHTQTTFSKISQAFLYNIALATKQHIKILALFHSIKLNHHNTLLNIPKFKQTTIEILLEVNNSKIFKHTVKLITVQKNNGKKSANHLTRTNTETGNSENFQTGNRQPTDNLSRYFSFLDRLQSSLLLLQVQDYSPETQMYHISDFISNYNKNTKLMLFDQSFQIKLLRLFQYQASMYECKFLICKNIKCYNSYDSLKSVITWIISKYEVSCNKNFST
eukprot:TRINITY_DN3818_c0_g1_i4.p1 TRINITY_DN3818_c0_g1~~TRINITY_DN3818_c0_g1_i4.p1  ORF type:complete len:231 (+),score=-20.86 TRINITY_DN3818_c0_g1_i4:1273-1965(+)